MLFKNILSPFDGSDSSANAIEYSISLSKLENAHITFIHILDNIKQGGVIGLRARYGDTHLIEGYHNARRNEAIEWIEPFENKAKKSGIETKVVILENEKNSKVETVVQYIEQNQIDLVVTGSRGLAQFKQMLVGSFASGIISHSRCPVLVIR